MANFKNLWQEFYRPSAKPICDQQFLGEAQSSTAEYSGVFEEHRQASTPKLPLEISFAEGLMLINLYSHHSSFANQRFYSTLRNTNSANQAYRLLETRSAR